jgi:hypothetical protein
VASSDAAIPSASSDSVLANTMPMSTGRVTSRPTMRPSAVGTSQSSTVMAICASR